jgi:hypothetical protein
MDVTVSGKVCSVARHCILDCNAIVDLKYVSHSFWNRFLATGTKWLNITYPKATVAFLSINGEIGFGIGQLGATIPASVEWLPGVGAEQQ